MGDSAGIDTNNLSPFANYAIVNRNINIGKLNLRHNQFLLSILLMLIAELGSWRDETGHIHRHFNEEVAYDHVSSDSDSFI